MKATKYTVMIDGDTCELEFDAVDSNDARMQYLVAIAKRLVIQKTKDMLAGKPAAPAPRKYKNEGDRIENEEMSDPPLDEEKPAAPGHEFCGQIVSGFPVKPNCECQKPAAAPRHARMIEFGKAPAPMYKEPAAAPPPDLHECEVTGNQVSEHTCQRCIPQHHSPKDRCSRWEKPTTAATLTANERAMLDHPATCVCHSCIPSKEPAAAPYMTAEIGSDGIVKYTSLPEEPAAAPQPVLARCGYVACAVCDDDGRCHSPAHRTKPESCPNHMPTTAAPQPDLTENDPSAPWNQSKPAAAPGEKKP